MENKYIIVSNCCKAESEQDSGKCAGCKDGCGFVKLFEDGSEENIE